MNVEHNKSNKNMTRKVTPANRDGSTSVGRIIMRASGCSPWTIPVLQHGHISKGHQHLHFQALSSLLTKAQVPQSPVKELPSFGSTSCGLAIADPGAAKATKLA